MNTIKSHDIICDETLSIFLDNLVGSYETNTILKAITLKIYAEYRHLICGLKFYNVAFCIEEHLRGVWNLYSDDMDVLDKYVDDNGIYTVDLLRVHADLPKESFTCQSIKYVFLYGYTEKFMLLKKLEG